MQAKQAAQKQTMALDEESEEEETAEGAAVAAVNPTPKSKKVSIPLSTVTAQAL